MVLWSAWLPDVLPHVAGCPNVIVEHELKRSAQQFFQASRAWQVTLDPVAVTADMEEVTISTGDSSIDLVRVEKAWYDGVPLDVASADSLDGEFGDDWQSHTGTPNSIVQIEPSIVRLYPVPTADAVTGLKCRVSVKSSETATGVPDNMAVRFKDGIIAGAKARLMLYPNAAWSNPEMAVVYAGAFDSMTSNARLDAARSYGRGRIAARPRWC